MIIISTKNKDKTSFLTQIVNEYLFLRCCSSNIIFKHYDIEDGFVVPSMEGANKSIDPCSEPNLLMDFASISNESDILNFVNKYGLLGRFFLDSSPTKSLAEPIDWIFAHVRGVRLCIYLSAWTLDMNISEIKRFFNSLPLKDDIPDLYEQYHFQIGKLGNIHNYFINRLSNGKDNKEDNEKKELDEYYLQLARSIRRYIININISQIKPEVIDPILFDFSSNLKDIEDVENIEDITIFTYHSLIEAIYWILNFTILNHKIKICQYCGKPFIQMHGREKYCPDQPGVTPCSLHARRKPKGE